MVHSSIFHSMSNRDWLSGLAVGGWWDRVHSVRVSYLLMGGRHQRYFLPVNTPPIRHKEPRHTHPTPMVRGRRLAISLSENSNAGIHQPKCEQPKSPQEADLCEQRRMANAAEAATCVGKVQLWSGIFGIGLVLVSLWLSAWAAIAAAKSANIAERHLEASERPWISVEMAIQQEVVLGSEYAQVMVRFNATNHGKSPALQVFVLPAVHEKEQLFGSALAAEFTRLRGEVTVGAFRDMGVTVFPDKGSSPMVTILLFKTAEFNAGGGSATVSGVLKYRGPGDEEVQILPTLPTWSASVASQRSQPAGRCQRIASRCTNCHLGMT